MAKKSVQIKGSITLTIDELALQASIAFSPNSDGDDWNTEKILKHLAEKNISTGFDSPFIEKVLSRFSSAKEGPLSEIIVRGNPPQPPIPEQVKWNEFPLPEHLKDDCARVFSRAGVPSIVKVSFEKVKQEKVIEKKGKFPFLGSKQEKVVEVEKKRIETPVDIDPEVVATGWVKKGDKIGSVIPGRPGVPGKNIFGKPIPPPSVEETAVYPGKGVEKKGSELIATEDGFLRRGKNWLEVIPFSVHAWGLSLSNDKSSCFLDFTPGEQGSPLPEPSEIVAKAVEMGVTPESLISEEEIRSIISEAVQSQRSITHVSISKDRDAHIEISISQDELKAMLILRKGKGKGKALDLKEVGTALRTCGLKGMNIEKIKKDILDFYRSPQDSLENYVLVEGKAPTRGEDKVVTFLVKFLGDQDVERIKGRSRELPLLKEEVDSLEKYPVDAAVGMAFVEENQQIAKIASPKAGTAGVDIYGKVLPAIPGNDPEIELLENVRMNQDIIVSGIKGVFEKISDGKKFVFRVRPHSDGQVNVLLSDDKMQAYLSLSAPIGTGSPISRELIEKALAQKGVVKGIKPESIAQAMEQLMAGAAVDRILVAEGAQPKDGGAGQVRFRITMASGKSVTLKRDGTADFRNQDKITSVKAGEIVADVFSPEGTAEDGWDVTGKVLPAQELPPIELELGKNIKEEVGEKGIRHLVAQQSGELLYDGKSIDVRDLHVVKGDVNLATGNVKFSGSVHVTGSVTSGFYIMAGGDIRIDETVQSALLSAEGMIIIKQGVKGAEKAVLRAKKQIEASFIEQTTILCVGDIKIQNACMRCRIKCNGKLILGKEKGTLIGGTIKVKKGIDVTTLGSESGVRTQISFGQDYLIEDQIALEQKEIDKANEKIASLDIIMKKNERLGDRTKLERIRQEKLQYLKMIEKRSVRLFNLREKFEEHYPSEIRISGSLYPGVIVESHGRFYETKMKKTGVILFFDSQTGRIQEKPFAAKKQEE